jgi:hypothetical protein
MGGCLFCLKTIGLRLSAVSKLPPENAMYDIVVGLYSLNPLATKNPASALLTGFLVFDD